MSVTADAHRLITLSLGKIASSRQQRGGINLHKNLLVASVLHKARTAYMMENFQTMIANRRSQAEADSGHSEEVKNTVIREVVTQERCETPKPMDVCERPAERDEEQVSDSRAGKGSKVSNGIELREDKENVSPVCEKSENSNTEITKCDNSVSSRLSARSCCVTDISNTDSSQSVLTDKRLSVDNTRNYVSKQTGPCVRCGDKRRRSMRDTESDTGLPKKPRMDSDCESNSDNVEKMQTETTPISSLVTIFNSGFGGLNGKMTSDTRNGSSGHVTVYSGHSYHVLADLSCGGQVKDSVTMPTGIALTV